MRSRAIALFCAAAAAAPSTGQPDSLIRGLVAGCIDRQEKLLAAREPTNDEKRRILHFCYCKAPNMATLVSDQNVARKLQLGDPAVVAAVKKIDATCVDAVNRGRLFAPGLKR